MNKLPAKREFLIYAALAVITFAAFEQVRKCDFINLDDFAYVSENPHVKTGLNGDSILWAFSFTKFVYWMPLSWLSHILDCQMFDLKAGMHHLTNLFLHIANALLLFTILRRTTGSLWRSAMAAALFALHPVNVDSVVWIAERKNILSTFFWMLTMLSYVYYTEKPSVKRYAAMVVFFIFGLLSKPMLITLPFVLLLLDYWPLGRFKAQDGRLKTLFASGELRAAIFEKLPLFVLAGISMILSSVSYKNPSYMPVVPMQLRTANAPVSYIKYISKLSWPADLAVLYPYPSSVPAWQSLGSLLLLAGISAFVILLMKKKPYLVTGWLWYTGTLVPVLGLVQIGIWPAMADRWLYVPSVGIFVMIVWGFYDLCAGRRYRRIALVLSASAVLPALYICTRIQVGYWYNSNILFEHTLAITGSNPIIRTDLGVVLSRQGKYDEAIENYQKAIQDWPDYAEAYFNLGIALQGQGKYDEAISNYRRAVELNPDYSDAYHNLGTMLQLQGKLNDAIRCYLRVIQLRPDSAEAQNNLGTMFSIQGRLDEAISYYRKALLLKPDYADAHYNLANALSSQSKFGEAINYYREAVKIKPDNAGIHYNLGSALLELNRFNEAIDQFQQSLRIEPNSAGAYSSLGNALLAQNRLDQAIAHYRRALQIKPDNVKVLYNLGYAYQLQNKLDDAIICYRRALQIEPNFVEAHNNLGGVLWAAGKPEEAVDHYRKALQIKPDYVDAAYNLGRLFQSQGKFEEAINNYRQILRIMPNHVDARNNLAEILASHPDPNIRNPEPIFILPGTQPN